jgi:hypothetical protein
MKKRCKHPTHRIQHFYADTRRQCRDCNLVFTDGMIDRALHLVYGAKKAKP